MHHVAENDSGSHPKRYRRTLATGLYQYLPWILRFLAHDPKVTDPPGRKNKNFLI